MANLACGKRLSLRNQYDTKTPRASAFCCARQTDGASSGRFVARPARSRDLLASRKNLQRGFRVDPDSIGVTPKMSVENFLDLGNEKISRSSRITAGLKLLEAATVFLKVSPA